MNIIGIENTTFKNRAYNIVFEYLSQISDFGRGKLAIAKTHLCDAIAAERLDAAGVLVGGQKADQLQRQLLQLLKRRGEARNHVRVPQPREEQWTPRHRKVRECAHEVESVLFDQWVELAAQGFDLRNEDNRYTRIQLIEQK